MAIIALPLPFFFEKFEKSSEKLFQKIINKVFN
jgi:hypothetical protein